MGTDQDFANVTAVLEQLWPLTQAYLALPSNASVADKVRGLSSHGRR